MTKTAPSRLFALCLKTLTILAGCLAAQAEAQHEALQAGLERQIAVERMPHVRKALYETFQEPPANWESSTGAVRLNVDWEADPTRRWFIEYQMMGGKYVSAGVLHGNREAIDWGLKVIEWGFKRMNEDGKFDHPDSYHSAAFFIESTAHSLLLLEGSPLKSGFEERIQMIKPRLLIAARWMMRADVHEFNWPEPIPGTEQRERKYTHRGYLNAAAVAETGILCSDPELVRQSQWFIEHGLGVQQPDGVNPERGGHDTSYQAVGLMYACRYYEIAADDALREKMQPMLSRGFEWMLSRILPDGSVDMTGNTRTGPAAELSRAGKPKSHDFPATVEAFAHWGLMTGEAQFGEAALRVAAFMESQKKP